MRDKLCLENRLLKDYKKKLQQQLRQVRAGVSHCVEMRSPPPPPLLPLLLALPPLPKGTDCYPPHCRPGTCLTAWHGSRSLTAWQLADLPRFALCALEKLRDGSEQFRGDWPSSARGDLSVQLGPPELGHRLSGTLCSMFLPKPRV